MSSRYDIKEETKRFDEENNKSGDPIVDNGVYHWPNGAWRDVGVGGAMMGPAFHQRPEDAAKTAERFRKLKVRVLEEGFSKLQRSLRDKLDHIDTYGGDPSSLLEDVERLRQLKVQVVEARAAMAPPSSPPASRTSGASAYAQKRADVLGEVRNALETLRV